MKIGDRLIIHSYKHDGSIHRSWDEAIYLGEENGYQIFGNSETLVVESNGRKWRTKEPAIIFFTKDHWFNIISQLKPDGIYYYCNIASPYVIEKNTIKYIDYDLDLRVFPNGSFKVLDRGEYKYHRKIMGYSRNLDEILRYELTALIKQVRNNEYPFNENLIKTKYKQYQKYGKTKNLIIK